MNTLSSYLALAASVSCTLAGLTGEILLHDGFQSHILGSTTYRRDWGMYSPYCAVDEYQLAPRHCNITQVNILQRHGARYPTTSATHGIKAALRKIQAVREYQDPQFDFLKSFVYDLGTDDLVPFGASQSFGAGELSFERYANLIDENNLPFIRASGCERVVKSAESWANGFAHASGNIFQPHVSVILSEAPHQNNTLDNKMCPNAGNGADQSDLWRSRFAPPITARLNSVAPGANLTDTDIISLLSLCPFGTVASDPAPFCGIFGLEDFQGYEYLADLDKYYGTGYGQALGPVQGVGYVNELLARLTGKPVVDHTQTNTTLDSSPVTFPLNRKVFADFSHDNQMVAIFAAMGLFSQRRALDPLQPDPTRTWVVSKLVPFSGRMVVEKLQCSVGEAADDFVRVFVNDALQPLEFCDAHNGMCRLNAFVDSQFYSRNDGAGDFQKCFP